MSSSVHFSHVSKKFGSGTEVLRDFSLTIPHGQFLSLVGPSGCGKSTVLRLVAGLEAATTGEISGVDPDSIAYVFQDAHLLPWKTVLENVMLPLDLKKRPRVKSRLEAKAVLQSVGLGEWENAYPAQLSGGMKMRVSIARSLVTKPQTLLMDEPFGALDEITRLELDGFLKELWRERKMTVLFVTHSISEAILLSQRVLVFSKRPARVLLDHASTGQDQEAKLLREVWDV